MPPPPPFCRDLERNLSSHLPEAGLVRRRRLAKISVREIYIDTAAAVPCVVSPVEEIENLKAELKIDSFRNAIVFVEIDTRFDEVWPAELHSLLISVLTKNRNREFALGNCPGQPGAVGG